MAETLALTRWDTARRAIAEAHSVDEVRNIRDKAEAYRYALKLAGEAPEVVRQAEEIKLRAERRAGELLREAPKASGQLKQGPRLQPETTEAETYAEQGIDKVQAHRWQKVAAIPEEKFEEYIATALEITTAGALRVADGKAHVTNNSGEIEWYTPEEHIVAVRAVLGAIDLDPASCEEANTIIGATEFYSKDDDALTKAWAGKVFLNPPYSGGLMLPFCTKLLDELRAGTVTEAIALTNNATETQWFQALLAEASAVCFPSGRIRFWRVGAESFTPLQGQTFFYFGPNPKRFRSTFDAFGCTALWRRANGLH